MNPDEASLHADSIVVNGAEGAWPKLLEDFEAGEMKEVYRGLRSKVFSEENYVMPRFSLLNGRDYNRLTIQTSRGCPLRCDFCSASIRLTSGFQQKPVALVVEEIKEALKHCDHRFFELSDDNTFVNKKWGKEFLRAIIPLKLTWFCMTDVSIADDEELLDLLAESGCVQILIGFESPDADDLKGINDNDWKRKRAGSYLEIIEKIQSRGITVSGCFVLGLDEQDTTIFKKVRDFVIESKLLEVQLTVLTAFPGTPLYSRLKAEGRLLSEKYWDRCTLFDVNYQPKKMSVQELQDGMLWLYKEVYNETQHTRRKRHYINIIKKRLAAKAKEDDSRDDLSASVPKEQTQTSTVLSRID
jgi:radical SAM superfamily enzyme YgiQ (UPF0313 family)